VFETESSDLWIEPENHRQKHQNKKPPNLSNCKQDRNFFLAADGILSDRGGGGIANFMTHALQPLASCGRIVFLLVIKLNKDKNR